MEIKFNTIEDMYSAVGFGAISATKIIAKILEAYKKDNQDEFIEQTLEELVLEKGRKIKPSNVGIVVEGIDNCLVRLSKCCTPVPGDEIVGFITRGRGVSVHRKDCVNINDLISQEDRMIDVYWYEDAQSSYNVDIEILANERNGLLADIIKQISSVKTRLIGINSKINKEKIVVTDITVEVENLEDLNNILKALRKIDNVYEVNRKK